MGDMPRALPARVKELSAALLGTGGRSSAALRRDVDRYAAQLTLDGQATQQIPEELIPYVDKVVLHAYKVTDRDIETLRASGYDEDTIFEITACATVATSRARLERALEVMG